MVKYTPGPWRAQGFNVVEGERSTVVAEAWQTTSRHKADEVAANARLIAAAPELLAAATEALAHFEKFTAGVHLDVKDSLKLAIAKATGRES